MTFDEQRQIALAILTQGQGLSRAAGSFLGQCAVERNPITEKQAAWFEQLAERAGIDIDGVPANG